MGASDETGRNEVFVQSFPQPARRYQVSLNAGSIPVWSRDGKELFFIASARKMMAVAVRAAAGSLEIEVPKALFDSRIVPGNFTNFDVSGDAPLFGCASRTRVGACLSHLYSTGRPL